MLLVDVGLVERVGDIDGERLDSLKRACLPFLFGDINVDCVLKL